MIEATNAPAPHEDAAPEPEAGDEIGELRREMESLWALAGRLENSLEGYLDNTTSGDDLP